MARAGTVKVKVELESLTILRMEVAAVERHPDGWVLTLQNESVVQDPVRVWTMGWNGPAPAVGEVVVIDLGREESTKGHEG